MNIDNKNETIKDLILTEILEYIQIGMYKTAISYLEALINIEKGEH